MTSTPVPSESPSETWRGSNLPSCSATNTTFRLPESITASSGMRRPSRSAFSSTTSPNIAGLSSPFALANSSRSFTVRVTAPDTASYP